MSRLTLRIFIEFFGPFFAKATAPDFISSLLFLWKKERRLDGSFSGNETSLEFEGSVPNSEWAEYVAWDSSANDHKQFGSFRECRIRCNGLVSINRDTATLPQNTHLLHTSEGVTVLTLSILKILRDRPHNIRNPLVLQFEKGIKSYLLSLSQSLTTN